MYIHLVLFVALLIFATIGIVFIVEYCLLVRDVNRRHREGL